VLDAEDDRPVEEVVEDQDAGDCKSDCGNQLAEKMLTALCIWFASAAFTAPSTLVRRRGGDEDAPSGAPAGFPGDSRSAAQVVDEKDDGSHVGDHHDGENQSAARSCVSTSPSEAGAKYP
jgi:hypothetical protein